MGKFEPSLQDSSSRLHFTTTNYHHFLQFLYKTSIFFFTDQHHHCSQCGYTLQFAARSGTEDTLQISSYFLYPKRKKAKAFSPH